MDLITAEHDGWSWLREHTFRRDGGCIAPQRSIMGDLVAPDGCTGPLEWDHVKEHLKAGAKAPNDEAHGVTVCSWHHRYSRSWRSDSKVNRARIREYLRGVYPSVWGAV